MVVKYIANDGTEFNNETDCKKYEESLETFTIVYINVHMEKEIYTGNGKDFNLTNLIVGTYAFKITAGYNVWNKFVNDNFQYLDDEIFHCYEIPVILEEQINQWFGYTIGKELEFFNYTVNEAESYAEQLKTVKSIL